MLNFIYPVPVEKGESHFLLVTGFWKKNQTFIYYIYCNSAALQSFWSSDIRNQLVEALKPFKCHHFFPQDAVFSNRNADCGVKVEEQFEAHHLWCVFQKGAKQAAREVKKKKNISFTCVHIYGCVCRR